LASDMHRRFRALVIAASALVIIATLAWGFASKQGLFAAVELPVEKLSIAMPTTPHAALLYIAAAKGYFELEGLEVAVTPVSHGKAALDLLEAGKVDLASAAEVPFVISVLKGARLGIAATVASTSTEMVVLARRDRGIAKPRDLIGKRVGVTLGTSGEYFLWAFLIRHRLAPDAVAMVDVPPGQMVQALTEGKIDAAATWEPVKSDVLAALAQNAVVLTATDAYTVTHVVIGHSEFLSSRPVALERFVRALLKAERFARSEPHQAQALVASQFKRDIKMVQVGWDDLDFKVALRQSQLVTLEDQARWAMARGYVDKGPVPNLVPNLYMAALAVVQPQRMSVVR
jgi:ABC-type nitrate/sulfonate/bicarbonate transport system substrate-binding protein